MSPAPVGSSPRIATIATIAAAFLALSVSFQIYLAMIDHGHAFWRLVVDPARCLACEFVCLAGNFVCSTTHVFFFFFFSVLQGQLCPRRFVPSVRIQSHRENAVGKAVG